jgi:RecJ-like exonuclease
MHDERCEACGRRIRESDDGLCGPCRTAHEKRESLESSAGYDPIIESGDLLDWENFQ